MRNKSIYISILFSSIGDEADFVFEAKLIEKCKNFK
jgi:hypothetical protein